MYLLGHMALGYLLSRPLASLTKRNPVSPAFLLLAGGIPDYDLLFGVLLPHGTLTHNLWIWIAAFAGLFFLLRWRILPYAVGVVQHFLIGDALVGSVAFLWPLTTIKLGLNLGVPSAADTILETSFFLGLVVYMYLSGDLHRIFMVRASNLWMILPLATLTGLSAFATGETELVPLATYGFARKALTIITIDHIILATIMAFSTLQGMRMLRKAHITRLQG